MDRIPNSTEVLTNKIGPFKLLSLSCVLTWTVQFVGNTFNTMWYPMILSIYGLNNKKGAYVIVSSCILSISGSFQARFELKSSIENFDYVLNFISFKINSSLYLYPMVNKSDPLQVWYVWCSGFSRF